jgi:DNA-binding transcriptional ArsR family regulator
VCLVGHPSVRPADGQGEEGSWSRTWAWTRAWPARPSGTRTTCSATWSSGSPPSPTPLQPLIAVHAAPGSSVKALAAATGLSANTVTQSLVTLRRSGLVENHRDGRLSRWSLSDSAGHELLHHLGAPHSALHPPH